MTDQQLRVSSRNAVTGELTVEVPGDYTVVQFQQRGDNTYVVLKPDPSGEGEMRRRSGRLEEINAAETATNEPIPVPEGADEQAASIEVDPAKGDLSTDSDLPEDGTVVDEQPADPEPTPDGPPAVAVADDAQEEPVNPDRPNDTAP